MVIVKIWGGLGNQLFQYSFGKYLAHQLGTQVKYDVQTNNTLSSFTQRDFVLSAFNVSLDIATKAEVDKMKYFRNIQLARIERKLAQQIPFIFPKHFVEQNIPLSPDKLSVKDNCYYQGYWQSYKYLAPCEAVLRNELLLKEQPGTAAKNICGRINASLSAGIHIRRGDYIAHPHFINCTTEYYQNAIAYLKQIDPGIEFFIFSDDIAWCKANFAGEEFSFVEGNSNYEDLWLMSLCRHQVIANSTFSWWAAWLNNNPGKKVVAPGKWHGKKEAGQNNLLPSEWIIMNT
jgi:Glycosyl transferase family 11